MEAIAPKRQIKLGQLAQGVSVCALAITCAGADIYNNAVFASEKSAGMLLAFVVAGAGLVLLPTMAKGRDMVVGFLVLVCGGLSLFAGYQNHMASQRNHDLAEAAVTERYHQAQAAIKAAEDDYRKAKADAEAVRETLGSAELQKLYDDAKDQRDKETSPERGGKCGPNCRAAEKVMNAALPRIGDAKAKEDAQKRMSEALARWNGEKQAAPKQAKAGGVSAAEEQIMAVLLLLLTIGGATLAHRGWDIVQGSFVDVPAPKAKREPAPKPVVKAAPVENSDGLKEFIGQAVTATEGEPTTSAKDAYTAMCSWWAVRQAGKPCPKEKAFGDAMTLAGIQRKKVKGRIHYQAKLEKQHLLVVREVA